jgi:hypothetical protein
VTSLTDEEFESEGISALEHQEYSVENYTALLAVLDARDAVSGDRDRLGYFFRAKGTEITTASAARSNIYLGDGLCN